MSPLHSALLQVSGPEGELTGSNGQACFWFSNGCSIGCQPEFAHKMDICGLNYTATVCDPAQRTVNTGAECGAEDDWYYYR